MLGCLLAGGGHKKEKDINKLLLLFAILVQLHVKVNKILLLNLVVKVFDNAKSIKRNFLNIFLNEEFWLF